MHSHWTQLRHSLAQSSLSDCDRVVEVNGAWILHAVLLVQKDFRWHATDCRGDGGDRDCSQVGDSTIASNDHNWTILVRRSEVVQAHIAAGYSGGHAASASQSLDSVVAGDCAE